MLRFDGYLSNTSLINSDLAALMLTKNATIARFTKAGMIIFMVFCKLEIITVISHISFADIPKHNNKSGIQSMAKVRNQKKSGSIRVYRVDAKGVTQEMERWVEQVMEDCLTRPVVSIDQFLVIKFLCY